MPAKSPEEWKAIREDYELGLPVGELAKDWDVSYEAIRRRAKREAWLNPRKIRSRAKEKLIEKRAELGEAAAEAWAERWLAGRKDLAAIASRGIRDFRDQVEAGEKPVETWSHLSTAASVLEKACGMEQSPGPALGLNIALLSTRQDSPVVIVDEEPLG